MALLPAAALIVAACGELTPPEAYAPSTSTTLVDGSEPQIDSQVEVADGQVARIDEFVPPPPSGYVPTLLISGVNYILGSEAVELETDGSIGSASAPLAGDLADLITTRAVDDLGGGLVIQEAENGPVVYYQALGQPQVLIETGARLLDVGFWNGSPRAFVEVGTGQVDWIQLLSEPGAELQRETHFQLAEDERIISFSASRDLQAVVIQDSQCGELRFYGADGTELDLPAPDPPDCAFPGRPTFGAVALSPDGDAVAYTIVSYRGDGTEAATALVARELLSENQSFADRRIGEDLDAITSLSFDGERAAYLRESAAGESVTVLDLTVENNTEVSVDLLDAGDVQSVSFARNPIAPIG